jgi:hypothetical protein
MDILNSIEVLTEKDCNLVTLEEIMDSDDSFTFDNPVTYMIFLSRRSDLSKEDVNIYHQIIERLSNNHRLKYAKIFKEMSSM